MKQVKRLTHVNPDSPIRHQGTLHILGHVLEGCSVESTDDIVITGTVYNARIYSRNGNVVIKDQVSGEYSSIVSEHRDVRCRNVEYASLHAGDNIYISNQAYHAHLDASGSIIMGQGDSHLVGGYARAGISIIAGRIGDGHTPSALCLWNIQQKLQFQRIMASKPYIPALQDQIQQVTYALEFLHALQEATGYTNFLSQVQEQYTSKLRALQTQMQKYTETLQENAVLLTQLGQYPRAIVAQSEVLPKVQIEIDGVQKTILEPTKRCFIHVTGDYMHVDPYNKYIQSLR